MLISFLAISIPLINNIEADYYSDVVMVLILVRLWVCAVSSENGQN